MLHRQALLRQQGGGGGEHKKGVVVQAIPFTAQEKAAAKHLKDELENKEEAASTALTAKILAAARQEYQQQQNPNLNQIGDWEAMQAGLHEVGCLLALLKNATDATNFSIASSYHAHRALLECFKDLLQLCEGPARLRAQSQLVILEKLETSKVFLKLLEGAP